MPPSLPGYPGGNHSDGHRRLFLRHGGIYQSDGGFLKPKNRERAGRITLSPIVSMGPAGYSSIGLVATRAHLRFTDATRII
jgi:hypothetical protein